MEFQPQNFLGTQSNESVDPMKRITEGIHHLVQQHLKGNDVKSAMEVSTEWHDFFVNSPAAMKQIILNFNVESRFRPSQKDLQMILNSPRSYSGLLFYCRSGTNIIGRSKVLTEFADILVSLKIDRVHYDVHMQPVSFKSLKSLEIGPDVSDGLIETLIDSVRHVQLQVLVFNNKSVSEEFIEFLMTQRQLKELCFSNAKPIFDLDDISFLCDLELTKLKLGKLFLEDFNVESFKLNILQLLASQALTLKYFGISCYDPDVMKAVMSLKNLKCLDISVYSMFQFQTFTTNDSIEYAKFDTNNCVDSDYAMFLRCMPNLRRLYHNTMTSEKLLVVVEAITKLQEILYTESLVRQDQKML